MSGEAKDVTAIRGLDTDLYNRMHAKAKEMGKNVSELMNDAMKLYVNQVLRVPTTYGEGLINLKVSKADLIKLGKVTIKGVINLTFREDVDEEDIENHLLSVESCVNVNVPQPIFVSIMKRARNCTNIQSYSVRTANAEGTDILRIGGMESLEISKEDLESVGKKVVLEDVEELRLSPDVDSEAVNQYIEIIRNVEQLAVPKSIFMLVLTKVVDCGEVSKY